jgi:hypothetical protein
VTTISRRQFLESGSCLAGLTVGGARRSTEAAPASFLGAQTHFGQYRAHVDDLLDLVQQAGIGWIRDEVYWSEIEKERGVFRFPPAYDQYLTAAQTRGVQVLLILDFGNALYSGAEKAGPATDAARQAFSRYCGEVVRRYTRFGVRTFEIWNEPNASTFWKPQPNPEDYARLLEAAYRSCKDADPGATVLGCSTSGTDLSFIGRVLDAGGGRFMDGVSFHPYCQPLPPERRLLADIAKLNGIAPGKPLWITEFGYPVYTGASGVDEETQANYLVRALLLARTSPLVERTFWYDFQNDGDIREDAECNFGLIRTDRTPKPAFRACKTMASLVGNLPPADFRITGNTYVLRFERGKDWLTAVWRLGGTESVAIPCSSGRYRIIERDGLARTVEAGGSVLELPASEEPRYVQPVVS